MYIGMTYDLRKDYLAAGFGEEETAEFDREDTVQAIQQALCDLGHEVDRIGTIKDLALRLGAGDRWDMVFNIAEGLKGFGREAQVPWELSNRKGGHEYGKKGHMCVDPLKPPGPDRSVHSDEE